VEIIDDKNQCSCVFGGKNWKKESTMKI
jgi:hypothetical protein